MCECEFAYRQKLKREKRKSEIDLRSIKIQCFTCCQNNKTAIVQGVGKEVDERRKRKFNNRLK